MAAVSPMGAMPTITAVPRLRSMSTAIRVVAPLPYASKAKWTPPPVSAWTRATAFSFRAFTTWVAPNFFAKSSAPSLTSTATIVVAPASRAPCSTLRPTPPQPITTTVSPGCTRALKTAAPTPVVTLQPISASTGKSSDAGAGTQPISGTTAYSAKHATLPMWAQSWPASVCRREVLSYSLPLVRACSSQRCGRPLSQEWQWPQFGTKLRMTRSPGLAIVTPSPTAWTVPDPSWPSTAGTAIVASPFWKCRSLRHTPAAATLMSTSPRLGGSSSTVSTEYGLLTSYSTAAVTRMAGALLFGRCARSLTAAAGLGQLVGDQLQPLRGDDLAGAPAHLLAGDRPLE